MTTASAHAPHADVLGRCPWPKDDQLYLAYHDQEWGVPEFDDRALYEKLVLDGFQAGLSWITILRKRENFRRAFDGFVPEKIARYSPKKVERLMQDAGIVRNRAKIEGAVLSARAWIETMENGPGFAKLLWDFVDGEPKVNSFRTMRQVPAETATSRAMSKELARRGFKFCGPTIVYAFMQAVGMVNDHLITCHRHEAVPQAPPQPASAPYDHDLQRLAEILGALHFLRGICGSNEGQKWRNEAQALIDAEAPAGERHDQMVASFNRGYRAFQQSYRTCTPAADFAVRRYLDEGARIAREITARYAN